MASQSSGIVHDLNGDLSRFISVPAGESQTFNYLHPDGKGEIRPTHTIRIHEGRDKGPADTV
ncbi:MAG: hypothetical protein R3B70_14380 [Polyangiaceae bacterium]